MTILSYARHLEGIPNSLINLAQDTINRISSDLRSKDAIIEIPEIEKDFIGIFTDGSNVLAERRGAGIAIFSAYSIKYGLEGNKKSIFGHSEISPEDTLMVILPRFAMVSRANTIMRAFEFISTLMNFDRNIDFIVLDGSYISTLLDPSRVISPIYRDLLNILRSSSAEVQQNFSQVIDYLDTQVTRMFDDIFGKGNLRTLPQDFIYNYYNIIEDIWNNTKDFMPEEALITYHNFIITLVEQNFSAWVLCKLLERAYREGKPILWLSKDSESRIITKNYRAINLSNDVSVLDFILRNGEILLMDKVKFLPPIEPMKNTVLEGENPLAGRKVYALTRKLANNIYGNFGGYSLVYVKYKNFVIQFTYPRKLIKKGEIMQIISLLRQISDEGYPEPLIYTHNRTVLRKQIVENLADGLFENCKRQGKNLLCNLISVAGRRLAGI